MGLSEGICLFLNKFFPKRTREGRESAQSYSEAQYSWAKKSLTLYDKYADIKDKYILDAGCGPGGKSVFYAEKGCKSVIGIDIDESRIKYAKEFASKKNISNIEFITGSLADLPFESNKFDFIFLNDVVEHINRPLLSKALEECKRVIKPDGRICLEFPPWSSYDASHLYDYIFIPWCQVIFSTETLVNVMKRLNPAQPAMGKLSVIDHFLELNHITIRESKELFKNLGFKIIHFDLIILLNIKFIRFIPLLNKYMTRRVVAVLGK